MDSHRAYERHASSFLKQRDRSAIGSNVVAQWASSLDQAAEVIEIGCGGGYPVTRILVDTGLQVWAIDSSQTLLNEFNARFPDVNTSCERLQESGFFNRQFSAAIAVGVVFLLPEDEQIKLLYDVAGILEDGGNFLFSAPEETGTWQDLNTGEECRSLGFDKYSAVLHSCGFTLIDTVSDSGKNNYYSCEYTASAE